jgi:RNA polymerase sigma factor (sigma-70 family)
MDSADDRTLLAAAAAGDRAAIAALVARHGPLVLAACRRQLRGAEADEAAQAVFLVLWRRAARAAAAPGLPGWLVVTARHVCATAIRAAARRRQAERQAVAPSDPAPADSEARERLDEALAALRAGEREAVVRRHLLGEDPATVAAALGCAQGTVHSRTSRGLERLRAWYTRRGLACSTAALAALCAGEAAGAAALPPAAVMACASPSTAATALAGAATAVPVVLIGAILMTITACVLAAILACTLPVSATAATPAGGDAPAPPTAVPTASETTMRIYDVSDLCRAEVAVVQIAQPAVTGRPVPGPEPRASADPASVAALDACRSWRAFCQLVQARTGPGSQARLVDAGLPDDDLLEPGPPMPAERKEILVRELRRSLGNGPAAVFPGMDLPRTLLVDATPAGHGRIEADLAMLRAARERIAAADRQVGMAALTFHTIIMRRCGSWPTGNTARPSAPPKGLPPALALPGGKASPLVWLPESMGGARPFAVACLGNGSLYALDRGIIWRADSLIPAKLALCLRRRLDRGEIQAPLTADHWQEAARIVLTDDGRGSFSQDFAAWLRGGDEGPATPGF